MKGGMDGEVESGGSPPEAFALGDQDQQQNKNRPFFHPLETMRSRESIHLSLIIKPQKKRMCRQRSFMEDSWGSDFFSRGHDSEYLEGWILSINSSHSSSSPYHECDKWLNQRPPLPRPCRVCVFRIPPVADLSTHTVLLSPLPIKHLYLLSGSQALPFLSECPGARPSNLECDGGGQ